MLYFTNYDLEQVVTPVNVNRYEELLTEAGYPAKKTKKLINGFKNGFSLGYKGDRNVCQTSPNLKITVGSETELWNKVMKEVKLKRFAGPYPINKPPFKRYIQSPIGLVPKDNGSDTILIFHLSYPREGGKSVNANIPKKLTKVKYPDFSEAIKLCLIEGKSCHLSRSDMKSTFRNLGISKKYWKYLLMKAKNPIDGKWYLFVDKCLPFGSAVSCKIFQDFSDSIAYLVRYQVGAGKKVTNYLDDYLFVALMKYLCNYQCQVFLNICSEIRFPIAMEKTFWANTRITFLGFLIDTVKQIVCVPLEKITKGVNMLKYVMAKKRITLKELQQLCGYLNFLAKCIVPGRTFTRRLYSPMNPNLKPHHHLRVNAEIKLDLAVWLQLLTHQSIFARPFMEYDRINAVDLDFYSDATANPFLGFGAYFGLDYMYHYWDADFIMKNKPSIGYLELFAVTAALLAWMPKLKNKRVVVFVDNKSVQSNLNKMTSNCKNEMVLIRLLVLEQMINNVRIYGKFVPSAQNEGADDLSRMRIEKFLLDSNKKGKTMNERTIVSSRIWPMEKVWIGK